jgi:hypothetical protein
MEWRLLWIHFAAGHSLVEREWPLLSSKRRHHFKTRKKVLERTKKYGRKSWWGQKPKMTMLARTSSHLLDCTNWRDSGTWFFHCSASTLNEFGRHEPLLLSNITVCPEHLLQCVALWVRNLAEDDALFPIACWKQNLTNIHWYNDLRSQRWFSYSLVLMWGHAVV